MNKDRRYYPRYISSYNKSLQFIGSNINKYFLSYITAMKDRHGWYISCNVYQKWYFSLIERALVHIRTKFIAGTRCVLLAYREEPKMSRVSYINQLTNRLWVNT